MRQVAAAPFELQIGERRHDVASRPRQHLRQVAATKAGAEAPARTAMVSSAEMPAAAETSKIAESRCNSRGGRQALFCGTVTADPPERIWSAEGRRRSDWMIVRGPGAREGTTWLLPDPQRAGEHEDGERLMSVSTPRRHRADSAPPPRR